MTQVRELSEGMHVHGEKYTAFVDLLQKTVSGRMGDHYEVRVYPVRKNNNVIADSITIRETGESVAPLIYLDPYYAAFSRGCSIHDLAEDVIAGFQNVRVKGRLDMGFFLDWEKVRKKVVCRLVGREQNKALLDEIPHRTFLDMAVIYYYQYNPSGEEEQKPGLGGIMIRSEFLKQWGITSALLDAEASVNTRRMYPPECRGMQEMMEEMIGTDFHGSEREREHLFVLTNKARCYGAFWMTDPDVLRNIYDLLQTDYYILPSSVHECMILSEKEGIDACARQAMGRDIKMTQVDPEEVLTHSVYLYQGAGQKLSVAACENAGQSG